VIIINYLIVNLMI